MWLEIYRWYQTRLTTSRTVLLERREHARFDRLEPIGSFEMPLSGALEIPRSPAVVFWTMSCGLSTEGKLRRLLFRVPEVRMTVERQGAASESFRVIPDVLVSPVLGGQLPGNVREFGETLGTAPVDGGVTRVSFSRRGDRIVRLDLSGTMARSGDIVVDTREQLQEALSEDQSLSIASDLANLSRKIAERQPVAETRERRSTIQSIFAEIRVHQWSKNLLVFLPVLMAHKAKDAEALWQAACAFLAFSMTASAIYLINDFCDLEADRRHPSKRRRPLASGDLSVALGAVLELVLLCAAASFVWLSGSARLGWILAGYAVLAIAYSLWLKHELLLDVMILSSLYTSRLLAGGAASGVPLSTWLLGFSIFLFLSMALIKRASEIQRHRRVASGEARIRGYVQDDLETITTIGVASGCTAALVIVLYMSGAEVRTLYPRPDFLWTISPVFLYWINQLWDQGSARAGSGGSDSLLPSRQDHVSGGRRDCSHSAGCERTCRVSFKAGAAIRGRNRKPFRSTGAAIVFPPRMRRRAFLPWALEEATGTVA